MVRDVKRRKVVKQYAKLRLQINALRYNTILPVQLRVCINSYVLILSEVVLSLFFKYELLSSY